MMLSINLKDSVFTTQSSTVYVDLKSKTKICIDTIRMYIYIYKKTYVSCTLSRSQYNSRTCLLKKKLSLLGAAPNRQNFEGSNFLKWALLHPPSTVLPICLRTARARPTKILRAVTFPKNVLCFNPHQ